MREVLRAVDEAIDGAEIFGTKAIMRALRDAGIEGDSIVIFLSDHGLMWGEHRLHRKGQPYEETIRTPMLVRYPKLAPLPRTEERFALNIDLAPMLVELAGGLSADGGRSRRVAVRAADRPRPETRFPRRATANSRGPMWGIFFHGPLCRSESLLSVIAKTQPVIPVIRTGTATPGQRVDRFNGILDSRKACSHRACFGSPPV
jgi:hypothetical protein